MPATRLSAHQLRPLSGGIAEGAAHPAGHHSFGRAALARRGVSRCHRAGPLRMGHRQGNSPAHLRRDAPDRFRRHRAKQDAGQDCQRLAQTKRPSSRSRRTRWTPSCAILSVRKIWGVGPKSAEKFKAQGVETCGDLQKFPLAELVRQWGKWGHELHQLCRGHDDREVEPNQVRKSLSNECTFPDNLTTLEECREALDTLVTELEEELRAKAGDRPVHKAFVKVKFADFTRTTRECVSAHPTPRDLPGPARRGPPAPRPADPVTGFRRPLRRGSWG